jgi:hypothetical protein
LIASRIPQAVINDFKTIDAKEENGKNSVVTTLVYLDGVSQAIEKENPIGQPGDGVGYFPGGDIGERSGHARWFAVAVEDGETTAEHPEIATVPVRHAMFTVEEIGLAAEVGINGSS